MKTVFATCILMLLTMSCQDKNVTDLPEKQEVERQDSATGMKSARSKPTIGIIYETENLQLYGDTSIDIDKFSYARIKFDPYIDFEDYRVSDVSHSKEAKLDLKSNKEAYNYRTILREGYKSDTANFAGHYTFIYFGCGSPCQSSFLIDRKTGKVYNAPTASVGYDFRVDSRMLIVNPPDSSGFYLDSFYGKPIIYVLDEQTKKFEEA